MNNYIQTGGYQAVNRSGEKSESNIENKAVLEKHAGFILQQSDIKYMLVTVSTDTIHYTLVNIFHTGGCDYFPNDQSRLSG